MATRKKKNVVELSRSHFQPYEPADGEEYMSKGQLEHFKQILLNWRALLHVYSFDFSIILER